MDKNLKTANDILTRFGIDPVDQWQVADAIRCALTDAEFGAAFGEENPVLEICKE